MNTDNEWERWGKLNPYYGVITDPKYRSNNLTDENKRQFFESGEDHVTAMLATIQRHIDPHFRPKKAMDFGSGTGRISIALAKSCEQVVGVDISDAMIAEARRNCEEMGITNARFEKSDDALVALGNEEFDLVHSFIVLQHIPVDRVRVIFERLLARLAPGGIGCLQLTYASHEYPDSYGVPPDSLKSMIRPHYRSYRAKLKSILFPARDPEMQMNNHVLNHLFFVMQAAGIGQFHTEFTDHGGHYGVFLYFKKPSDAEVKPIVQSS